MRPKLAPFIAEIIARWASLEMVTSIILGHVLQTDAAPITAMLHAINSASARIDMMEAAGAAKLFDPELELFQAFMKIIRSAARKRNPIAHHIWGYTEELPEALLLIEPEAQLDVSVRAQNALRGFSTETHLVLQPDRDRVLVYREGDFIQITEEQKTISKSAFLLVLYLERASFHDQIYPQLCAEPLIDAALKSIRKSRQPRSRPQQPDPQTPNE
ncbi:MAG TPA: hypothetical protein VK804_22765 [Bradyrhizobium sp.]|uniref:hypothetical protein n=1 Tax=Bradyrhizobium sp. TaxID=376 RepID=UPI002C77E8A8|nr:hypothetical protein [Bradyrhizobium sp.]HTB03303.1 hypothetical protein [Bradyrhizobium sp.]